MPGRDPVPRRLLRHKEVGDDFWLLLVRSSRTYVCCGANPEHGVIGKQNRLPGDLKAALLRQSIAHLLGQSKRLYSHDRY